MSYLTEYFDEFRQHPMRKTKMCRPEDRWAKVKGKWLDPNKGADEKVWTEEENQEFIKKTMHGIRGQSTYYNDICAHLDQDFKTRPFVPRKKLPPWAEREKQEDVLEAPTAKLAMKDTELMKVAKELYEQDDKPTLEPLPTHFRLLGYVRPCRFKTGLSDYQGGIARLAFEMIRDDRIPRYQKHNGYRPVWGYPPDETRQPELDVVPFDGERLF